jgi:hypothetical protein
VKTRLIALSAVVVCGALAFGASTASAATTVVGPGDIGTSWSTNDTRSGGTVAIDAAHAAPSGLGASSLHFTTTDANGSSNAKAQLFNYGYIGAPLSSIDALGYWDYRSSASTNSAVQHVGLNVEVDYVGDGSSYTALVFEPVYQAGGAGALQDDTWQYWDALNGGAGVWWSTKDIPGVCAFNCFVSWSTILADNPNAKVKYGLGFNVGSGWTGQFSGAADGLTVGVSGNSTTYDFEVPVGPPTSKDQCKDGGWQTFNNPSFKNQGDCVSYVATQGKNPGNG